MPVRAPLRRGPLGLHWIRRSVWTCSVAALFLLAFTSNALAGPIELNGSQVGQELDGIGVISAGGEGRLFKDYPQEQQQEMLDYMFCSPRTLPQTDRCAASQRFGVAAQIFKVEIGG